MIQIFPKNSSYQPLDTLRLTASDPGKLVVRDGRGRTYFKAPAEGEVTCRVCGATGTHIVFLIDPEGRILGETSFTVEVQTEIEDGGRFRKLFDQLYDTLHQHWTMGYTKYLRIDGKRYKYYVSWLRDHVHALKGMKYFDGDVKTGIELYADSQREDGMIWDKCKELCHSDWQNWRDFEFAEGDFVRPIPGNPTRRWMRVPVENDVEFLFLEGIYYTWKACGDNAWMAGLLDKAIRAVKYGMSDPYRWSEKFQLLKRGYTIDTWDFQSADDIRRSGSAMRVHPDRTEFSVFHGDNTGMAVGCLYLAEMLRVANRQAEAEEFEQRGKALQKRLDDLSWNGRFYTHMVPENPDAERDLGDTPTDEQVTLSNAYALNRRIRDDQCRAIIESYQRIREVMPESSPGEWYNCYPPFEKGYHHNDWNYMNGGVSTICAGELARGAFAQGQEAYAVDILDRIIELAERCGGYLHNTFKGKLPERPKTRFTPIPLTEVANVGIEGESTEGNPDARWTDEGVNDMRSLPTGNNEFAGIPFEVNDPAANGHRVVIGISKNAPYRREQAVSIGAQAHGLYILHTAQGSGLIGEFIARYEDGSEATTYVETGKQLDSWFMPSPDEVAGSNLRDKKPYRMGWQGPNGLCENVGMFVWGWNNPNPEKLIREVIFRALETNAVWFIGGVTRSDKPVFFPVGILSYGIPDMWGAAAVLYALVEGLAGIVDESTAFRQVSLRPRWAAAGVEKVTACAHYPASGGYLRYRYTQTANGLSLDIASAAEAIEAELLLPAGADPTALQINGINVDVETRTDGDSTYLQLPLDGMCVHRVVVEC